MKDKQSNMRNYLVGVLIVLFLSACNKEETVGKYTIVSDGGWTKVLNTTTGELYKFTSDNTIEIININTGQKTIKQIKQ